jgi:hypothetical protein
MAQLEIEDGKVAVRGLQLEVVRRGTGPLLLPDSVFEQIKSHYQHVGGYGHLLLMGQVGFLDHRETVSGIDRVARDVEPRLRELA